MNRGNKMKHYIEIQRLRTQDVIVDDTLTLEKNTDAFIQGDIISITEKIDGANSSIYYDKKLDRLRCFSSKNELDFSNQLRGFLTYVESLDKEPFIKYPNYIFFGEWLVSHTVIYDDSNYNKWYLFSVYDTVSGRWLSQDFVKNLQKKMIFVTRMNYTMDHLLVGTIVSALSMPRHMARSKRNRHKESDCTGAGKRSAYIKICKSGVQGNAEEES